MSFPFGSDGATSAANKIVNAAERGDKDAINTILVNVSSLQLIEELALAMKKQTDPEGKDKQPEPTKAEGTQGTAEASGGKKTSSKRGKKRFGITASELKTIRAEVPEFLAPCLATTRIQPRGRRRRADPPPSDPGPPPPPPPPPAHDPSVEVNFPAMANEVMHMSGVEAVGYVARLQQRMADAFFRERGVQVNWGEVMLETAMRTLMKGAD